MTKPAPPRYFEVTAFVETWDRVKRIVAGAILMATGLGCSTDPSASVSLSGTAERSCGPTDGPAVALDLRGEAAATVRIFVYRSRSELPARAWIISPTGIEGSAIRCPEGGVCEGALQGQVRFDQAGNNLRGQVAIRFPGVTVSGPFRATWREVNVLCG